MNYSQYQRDIFRQCQSSDDNIIVEATAGSGKTTVLTEACKFLSGDIVVCSFSKLIADELSKRVPVGVESATLNALGYRILRNNYKRVRVNKWKDQEILRKLTDEDVFIALKHPVDRIISLLKNNLVEEWEVFKRTRELLAFHAIDIPEKYDDGTFEELVERVYVKSLNQTDVISFDDQKILPVIRELNIRKYDNGLVDEVQDSSPLDVALIEKICNRKILVGDRHQCQPEGTLVSTIKNRDIIQVPIEQLKIDDRVVSWHERIRYWSKNERVRDVSWREYEGELVCIKTDDGHISKYTPNHKCITKFYPLTGHHCVYLMKKDNNYRVGKTKLNYGLNGNGLIIRLRAEKGDAIWILTTHKTSEEAYLEEQYISNVFNLPQMVFTQGNKSLMKQEKIDWFWNYCGNNEYEANKCLKYHKRDIKYPLFSKDKISPWQDSLKRTMITEACNLMNDCLVLPFNKNDIIDRAFYLYEWRKIQVTREQYKGKVYSLSITGEETYVADKILTHNSIMGFRSAMSDAMDHIKERFACVELPLSICYRCPEKVIDEAKKINPRIESPTDHGMMNKNGEGIVGMISKERFRKIVEGRDMVICRTTAPLIKECLKMLPYEPCYVRGRDIGEGLERLVKVVGGGDIGDFDKRLDAYKFEQVDRLAKLNREAAISELEDKVESLKALEERVSNTGELIELIRTVIVENGEGIVFMTQHKSKGMENKSVFWLRPDLNPHKRAKQEWMQEQEKNLMFVATTRSQHSLMYVEKGKDE